MLDPDTATAPGRGLRLIRNPELDGLRGVAILLVLGWHLGLPLLRSAGVVGVTLFFALSGYLITSILLKEYAAARSISFRRFYLRRALRLLPALVVVIAFALVAGAMGAWGDRFGQIAAGTAFSLAYVANWAAIGTDLSVLGHTWSLSIEEQFYLLWPALLLIGLGRVGQRRLGFLVVLVAVAIAIERVWLVNAGDVSFQRIYFGTDTRGDAVLYGSAMALLGARPHRRVALYTGLAIALSVVIFVESSMFYLAWILPLVAFGSAIVAASGPAVLAWPPLVAVGRISYGLYLWHYLFIWWGLPLPIALALTFAAAGLSYRFIEQPFLRLKDRLDGARPAPRRVDAEPGVKVVPLEGVN